MIYDQHCSAVKIASLCVLIPLFFFFFFGLSPEHMDNRKKYIKSTLQLREAMETCFALSFETSAISALVGILQRTRMCSSAPQPVLYIRLEQPI